MSEVNFVSQLAQVGVKAEAADPVEEGHLEVACTIGQYSKLMEVLPTTKLLTIRGNRVVAGVDPEALAKAVAEHVKAPRAAGNVTIATRTVYTVSFAEGSEVMNPVKGGWWDSDAANGEIAIGKKAIVVQVGRAADFYEVDEDSADRQVFYCDLNVEDEKGEADVVQLSSYSFMNLLKRVCSVRVKITG